MAKLGNNYIAALDIGTSKIVCLIAHISADNDLSIIGIGHQISRGIKSGTITDIKLAEDSIRAAVGAAEEMAGVTIDNIIVNISGSKQKSSHLKVEASVAGNSVSRKDISRLITEGFNQSKSDETAIIHCIPLEFIIDGTRGIKDPCDMFGRVLGVYLHIVTVSSAAIFNLAGCLAKCHLDIDDYITSSYASSLAVMQEDEKELGSILLDFGGGNTSIAVFKGGNMVYSGTVPIGGMHITNDLAIGLSTNIESAERIKNLYGNVITSSRDDQEIIDIPHIGEGGNEETSNVPRSHIVDIIKPRVQEILEMVKKNLDASGYGNIGGNIVITGGGSQLAGLKDMTVSVFRKQVRQGLPLYIEGMAENTKGPAFATSCGMILAQLKRRTDNKFGLGGYGSRDKGIFGGVIRWFKDNF